MGLHAEFAAENVTVLSLAVWTIEASMDLMLFQHRQDLLVLL